MRGQPVHTTRPHARLPTSSLGMDAWMTSQLNVALFCKLGVSFTCSAYLLICYPWVYVQKGYDTRPIYFWRNYLSVLYMCMSFAAMGSAENEGISRTEGLPWKARSQGGNLYYSSKSKL